MSGQTTPESSGLLVILTVEDALHVTLSILTGCVAIVLVQSAYPYADPGVLALFGFCVANIPSVYLVVLNGIDPERDPHLLNNRHH